jgi:tRNA (guanine-N7-)-methyltransferase
MTPSNRKIKSFVKRESRMTDRQIQAYDAMMPVFGLPYKTEIIDFTSLFNNSHPICLEIGFGMGDSLLQQAIHSPHLNYVGIEVHKPGVGALCSKLQMKHESKIQEGIISNIRIISHDAVDVLANMIANDSLHCVQLFFPDPWHKRKHNKRRIVQKSFIQLLFTKLQLKGSLHMATDWEDYARHMLKTMNECIQEQKKQTHNEVWFNTSNTHDYIPQPHSRPSTKFQKRGENLGHSIWDLFFMKV